MALPSEGTVLISGYYGFSNTGDEAILAVILEQLRERLGAGTRFQVISGSPEVTAAIYQVEAISWRDTAAIAQAVRDAALVVTGGGGIFHDYGGVNADGFLTEGNWGIGFHATAAILAALFEKPLALCAVGVGPLLTAEAALYVRGVFGAANYASVRDEASRELAGRAEVTADPAFLLSAAPAERVREIWAEEGIPEPPAGASRVVVAIRHWAHEVEPEVWERELARGLDAFAAAHKGAQLVFVPFQRFPGEEEDDLTVARRVHGRLEAASYVVRGRYQPSEVAALLGAASMVVAMRLHAAIFCLRAGVPFVAITYDGKVRHLLERVGRPYLGVAPGELTAEALQAACGRAMGEAPVAVEPLRAAARETFARIAALVADPRPAQLTGEGRELLRQGVLALTAREKFLRAWLSDQQTNYEYIVRVGKEDLARSEAEAARERESARVAFEEERGRVAALDEEKARLEGLVAEREATLALQLGTIAERDAALAAREGVIAAQVETIGERDRAIGELQAQLAAGREAHGELGRHHAEREAGWGAYAAEMQSKLAAYRGQRAWRVMLAARRAYTVATRRGWVYLVPWVWQVLRGRGNVESEQLVFPLPPMGEGRDVGVARGSGDRSGDPPPIG